jgi:predicted dienelactone hydrolase
MAYDPFSRGPFPVGVDTITLRGAQAVEVWYPGVSSSSGLDLRIESQDRFRPTPSAPEQRQAAVRDAVPRLGSFPLAVFAHRSKGHRRAWAPLCTHVASHGYVVAAADHTGALDVWAADLSLIIDELCAGRGGSGASHLDRERIAVTGAGLGGWAALAAIAGDALFAVAAVIDPGADGESRSDLDTGWPRLVPTLIVNTGHEPGATLEQVRALHRQLRTPRRLLVLRDAGVEEGDEVVRGVILAHLDAHLRDLDEARDLMGGEPESWLEPRGVRARWDT